MMGSQTEYVTIKLPSEIVDEIDSYVGKKGYSSRTEVVKDALRDWFSKHPQTNELKSESV